MNKKHMEMLLTIEKHGNITKAADHLGITQPTLSQLLARVESDLQLKLFSRYARTLSPTDAGAIYLDTFREILSKWTEAEDKVLQLKNEFVNEFSLGTHHVLGEIILPKIEKEVREYQKIGLRYVIKNSREITEEVANGRVDFGIVADPQKYPDLIIKPLKKEFTGLYSKDGLEKDSLFFNSEMIMANKFVTETSAIKKRELDDYSTICSLLKEADAMGLLPSLVARSDQRLRLIKRVGPEVEISLIYHASRTRSRAMTKVISIFKEAAKLI